MVSHFIYFRPDPGAHGDDPAVVPVWPRQHQPRDPDLAAGVSPDERQAQEPPGGQGRALPVRRRHGGARRDDSVRFLFDLGNG